MAWIFFNPEATSDYCIPEYAGYQLLMNATSANSLHNLLGYRIQININRCQLPGRLVLVEVAVKGISCDDTHLWPSSGSVFTGVDPGIRQWGHLPLQILVNISPQRQFSLSSDRS